MEWCYRYNIAKGRMGYTKNIPYTAKDDFNCNNNNNGGNALADSNVKVTANVKVKGDTQLLAAAASHVVSVAIYVGGSFMSYKSGVYVDSTCNSKSANHAVSVAGYGTLGSNNYWLVRNSWGTNWGDKGYIKMDRNKQNMCHISTYSHYPKVECDPEGSCKAVKPDDADSSGGDGDDESDDGGEEDDSDDDGDNSVCSFGTKKKGELIKGSKIGDCQKSLTDAKKVCEANKSTCIGVNKGKKKCFYAVSAKSTKTKKTKTKFYAIKFSCAEEEEEEEDDNDGCPSGTMRCDDGVCKHEHMC